MLRRYWVKCEPGAESLGPWRGAGRWSANI